MFKNQPKGLYVLALANTGERFGYYTMLAILLLFLQAKFALSTATATFIYSTFLALVYFMPMLGGMIADKWNFQKTVSLGIIVMFAGYLVMSLPTQPGATLSMVIMFAALFLISAGTGLFKGNLQVMVGDLYNDPRYSEKRDVAFSLFYMAINIGAMFAPSVTEYLCSMAMHSNGLEYNPALPGLCNAFIAGELTDPAKIATLQSLAGNVSDLAQWCRTYMDTLTTGYSYAFAVACGSMVLSFLIYKLGVKTYDGVSDGKASANSTNGKANAPELTKEQTKSRIVALLLVFAVVIFFWMVFHQNGATLTKFAQQFTSTTAGGWTRIGFNVWALATIVVAVYSAFSMFQSSTGRARGISAIIFAASIAGLYFIYGNTPDVVSGIQPQIFQQFNPFFVIVLTPVSLAVFGYLAKKKKEPSAPRKIGIGMVIAACGFLIMALGSLGLPTPAAVEANGISADVLVSSNWLISTYLVLTFAELLLSPMGISFVSKVAPPKYKGMMMGGWFVATAIGNYLVAIIGYLWGGMQLWMVWSVLIVCCLLSALFIFSIMKRLEKVAK